MAVKEVFGQQSVDIGYFSLSPPLFMLCFSAISISCQGIFERENALLLNGIGISYHGIL